METTLDEFDKKDREARFTIRKKKWLGALLNLVVPGMGIGYARFINTGLFYYFLFYLLIFSTRFISINFVLLCISVCSVFAFMIFLMIRGYRDVDDKKNYPESKYDKWYIYIVFFIFHTIFWSGFQLYIINRIAPISFANIPTESMNPGLRAGDRIAVKSTHVLQRNDVAIFTNPYDDVRYAHRCIGLPGDSLSIKRGTVFINHDSTLATTAVAYSYWVTTKGAILTERTLDDLEINAPYREGDNARFFLTKGQAEHLRAMPVVRSVDIQLDAPRAEQRGIFVTSNPYHWNSDYFGSVYIPKKGDRILLNGPNAAIYFDVVKSENQPAQVSLGADGIFIDGKNVDHYTFKENYYFMLGDSRHNSIDSRFYGFVSESRVLGKGLFIYWGKRSGRIGKKI